MMNWFTSELPIGRLLSGKGTFEDYMIVVAIIAFLALFCLGTYLRE